MTENADGMLSPYRVLDLTDEKALLCGKLMGDMGADVIKIERPGGDSARNIGPFYHDEVDPEKSLYWFAVNTSKRGITLDIEKTEGLNIFKELVKTADFVIESFPPGYMDKLGLGYSDLEKLNPGLIMVSIAPFGQTGPYKDFKGPDMVMWALGAGPFIRSFDSPDRPPFRVSHHSQTYFHAGTEAVVGALVALFHRGTSGEGQHVDVSIQECVNWHPTGDWDLNRRVPKRGQSLIPVRVTHIWPCKDGYVMWRYTGGPMAKRHSIPLVNWIAEEGMADDWLKNFDWDNFSHYKTTQEIIDRMEEQTINFFMTHTKVELMAGAIKYRIMLYPISSALDLSESPQLAARGFWTEVEHPELGTTIKYPGKWANNSETPPVIARRAPLIGEHNQEIFEKELGISKESLEKLRQAGVI
ncbi:MAG: CoA transferase [Deltaproteobacteria bacterium]|nr:CoA transferase [Deltaproteobacteria bacterium]